MQLRLENILPLFFDEERKRNSEIWGRDLQFNRGEYIKIVAPSGSGKTSLIHFIYGLRKEYAGAILFDGRDLATFGAEDFASQRKNSVSIVFQDLRLFPDRTVFENINIKRQLDAFHPAERIREMCERLGIGDKLSSLCRTCSYGEQQRVAIIRSLMQPFDFLLLDEPFSHLDNRNSEKAMDLMLEEASIRKASILFADLERIDYFPYHQIFHL
jgi:putative ABC transport system ATP-binding protein